jgi:hypothetical protein
MTEICSTISSGSNVVTPDIVVADVRRLIDTEGLTFRAVGRLEPYNDIPPGTIYDMYQGKVAKTRYEQLGIPVPVEVFPCPVHGVIHLGRCPDIKHPKQKRTPGGWVNAKDPKRAAKQLLGRAEYTKEELVDALEQEVEDRIFDEWIKLSGEVREKEKQSDQTRI